MQTDSLVVVLPIPPEYKIKHKWYLENIVWLPNDNGKDIYTVRYIGPASDSPSERVVAFREGIMAMNNGIEMGVSAKYVKEVQGPDEVNVQEIVDEAICVTI